MRKAIVLFSVLLVCLSFIRSVPKEDDKVHWITVEELQQAYDSNPKPIIMDVYTTWCKWCKTMDANTYMNDSVANYINEHYYAVKFDAETKGSIKWLGHNFSFNEKYKVNEFSIYITNGHMSYPTTVLLTGISLASNPLTGYLTPPQIEGPLKFIGDGIYKKKSFSDFAKGFSATW